MVPYLGFPRKRSNSADFLGPQGVDDRAFAHIGVSNESHADLFLISVELW